MPQSPVGRQRSVLVVGAGVTAGAAAGFLQQAGVETVVAPPAHHRATAGQTVLWRPGLVLLERIGLRRPVEQFGTRLDSRTCLGSDRTRKGEASTRPSLLAVDDDRFIRLFETQVFDSVGTTEQAVTAVEPTESGVRATFEGRVTELFDAVVTTSRSLLPSRPRESTTVGLHAWGFEWPSGLAAPPAPAEAWGDRRAAFCTPVDDRHWVQLVSTAAVGAAAALSIDDLERRFGRLFEGEAPFASLDQQRLRYSRAAPGVPTTRSKNGIILVGAAARGSVPGDCLHPTLGIEDAWVLADALAYGPAEVEAAVAAYEHRRRRRGRALASAVADDPAPASTVADDPAPDCPADCSAALRWLHARRTLAFSHTHDSQPHPLAASIPQRL